PQPGILVSHQPPEPIREEPPDFQQPGDNVQWISGYWAWDAGRNDFIWISGVLRNAPAGYQFVPGHWVQTEGGWRWVPGFWAPQSQGELQYLPEPPAPLEVEPSLPPPNDDAVYVPGYWSYGDSRYLWRPGYYALGRPGRVWISPRYLWTPNGYLFVNGYWDR